MGHPPPPPPSADDRIDAALQEISVVLAKTTTALTDITSALLATNAALTKTGAVLDLLLLSRQSGPDVIPVPLVLTSFLITETDDGPLENCTIDVSKNIKLVALDQFGNTLTSYTGTPTISSNGTLSAGSGATAAFTSGVLASHAVTFSVVGSDLTITATDGIASVSTPFQVVEASATWPNEPAGYVLINDWDFSSETSTGWTKIDSADRFSITTDAGAPISPSNVGQAKYPAGFSGGVGPFTLERSLSNAATLYHGFPIKWSSNWQNHSSGVNKVFHYWINGINRVVFFGRGNSLVPAMACQQLAQAYLGSTSVHLVPNIVPGAVMTRDVWHRMELLMVANTPGVADGELHWWMDNVKIGAYTGIMFAATGGNGAWETIKWNPTWGGTGGTVTEEMYHWLDHSHLSESP